MGKKKEPIVYSVCCKNGHVYTTTDPPGQRHCPTCKTTRPRQRKGRKFT